MSIQKSTLTFLSSLEKNNNREWFLKNKTAYTNAHENMIAFAEELMSRMNTHDQIETASGRKSLYRIYRDMRFGPEKEPYNPRFAGGMARVKPLLRGGYYFHIKPSESFIACGFFAPSPEDLKTIRMDISYNHKDWEKLLNAKSLKNNFNKLEGDKVLTTPKGFDKNNPGIKLLRHKQFLLRHPFSDKEVLSPDFAEQVSKTFKSVRPFFNYMSELLTTDGNGLPLVKKNK